MKIKIPKRPRGIPNTAACCLQCCVTLDRSMPGVRTACLAAGVLGAAFGTGASADYVFIIGLLFHLAIWFQNWWLLDGSG